LKNYEAVFILDERQYKDGGEEFAKNFVKLAEKLGGKIIKQNAMGRRQFARPIRKQKSGIYWDFILNLAPEQVIEIKEAYRLDTSIFRCVVFLYEGPELD
jgi:small subunit ribosomal protein S6